MNIYRKRAVVVTTVIVLLLVPAVTWTQRWEIFDWWRLRAYEAPSEIAVLADRTTMTDYARKLLYVYHAELQDKEGFNQHCQNAEHTIVLGCFVEGQGIYL